MSVGAIVGIVYGVGALVCWRMAAGHIAYEGNSRHPDWPEGIMFGGFAALVWPAVLFGVLAACLIPRMPSIKVGAERRAIQRARERKIEERERAIAQAERELGIK